MEELTAGGPSSGGSENRGGSDSNQAGAAGESAQETCTDHVRNQDETHIDCGGSCVPCALGAPCLVADDCVSHACRDEKCVEISCTDGQRNGSESDVDCGGSCAPCAAEQACGSGADCASRSCGDDVCLEPTCEDRTQNGDETGADCGGTCSACELGVGCVVAADCLSSVCQSSICVPQSCSDLQEDQDETDVDCGGSCAPCDEGEHCLLGGDCVSGVCADEACQAPTCEDEIDNGSETDVDCGGGCKACPDDASCASGADCVSLVCKQTLCVAATCQDGVKNAGELDVDCGRDCGLCEAGQHCNVDGDCDSAVCGSGTCSAPSCSDQMVNGPETDVDCGGSCQACAVNAKCKAGSDCASKICSANVCAAPSCKDGVANGSESGVDCGGSCKACALAGACSVGADCASNTCIAGRCAVADFAIDANRRYMLDLGTNLRAADLDHDGDLDLVGIGRYGHQVNVHLNDGDARFTLAATVKPPNDPDPFNSYSMALGDLNGDGDLDLVVVDWTNIFVLTALGKGDGTFGPTVRQRAQPGKVAIADFNGDEKQDVIVGKALYGGNGDGTLQAARDLGTGSGRMTVGDLNGDGYLDLADNRVWLNDGTAHFSEAPTVGSCQGSGSGFIVDLDGDGTNDTTVPTDGLVFNCANDGKGVLSERNYSPIAGSYPGEMSLADFNGDGRPDQVQTLMGANLGEGRNGFSYPGASAIVTLNRGNFGFGLSSVVSTGFQDGSVTAGDFDGDGFADFVQSGNLQGMVVARGRGDGIFRAPRLFAGDLTSKPAIADANGDGFLDVLSGTHSLMLGGKGRFEPPVGGTAATSEHAFADLDGDGDLDAVEAQGARTGGYENVGVYIRTGLSTFAPAVRYKACRGAISVATADFDSDGDVDVGVACVGEYFQIGETYGSVGVLLNSGNGTLSAVQEIKTNTYHPMRIIADNFGQASPRLVVLDEGDGGIKLLTPTGSGKFGAPQDISRIGVPKALSAGDVNGDGLRDLVVVGGPDEGATFGDPIPEGSLRVLLNTGSGYFAGGGEYSTAPGPTNVSTGNLDGDGRDDILVTSAVSGALSVFRPIGSAGALEREDYGVSPDLATALVMDADQDGLNDIVAGSRYSFWLIRNLSRVAAPAPPSSTCGDNTIDAGEGCDGTQLGGKTCGSLMSGATGKLGCSAYCELDLSGCSLSAPCGPANQYQAGAPWPGAGRCPDHAGRSDSTGPTAPVLKWSVVTDARKLSGPAIDAKGQVYTAGTSLKAYTYDKTGKLLSAFPLPRPSSHVPALSANGHASVTGDTGFRNDYDGVLGQYVDQIYGNGGSTAVMLFKLGLSGDGTKCQGSGLYDMWCAETSFHADSAVVTTPGLAPDGSIVFGTLLGSVYSITVAYDPGPGGFSTSLVWKSSLAHPVSGDLAISPSGNIYVPTTDGSLSRVDPTGRLLWQQKLGQSVSQPALAADGTIFVTTESRLLALNPNGSLRWEVPGAFATSAPSADAKGHVYVGIDGSSLAVYDATGTQLAKVVPPGAAAASSRVSQPALGADQTVYYTAGGTVYAVGP
jgi:hypothetical protein